MAKNISTTPKGIAVWPRLDAPDTKFDEAGIYSVKLRLSAEDASPLVEAIDNAMQEQLEAARKEAKSPMKAKKVKLADTPYAEDEDGSYLFTFKMKASGKTREGKKYTAAPALYDAKGKPVNGLAVGNGSIIKVGYELSPFFTQLVGAGCSLRLKAVQIITLVERGQADASYFGFGEEEGFEADESQINSKKPSGPFKDESSASTDDTDEDLDESIDESDLDGSGDDDF